MSNEPTVTVLLSEYNQLVEDASKLKERKYTVVAKHYWMAPDLTRYSTNSKVIKELCEVNKELIEKNHILVQEIGVLKNKIDSALREGKVEKFWKFWK